MQTTKHNARQYHLRKQLQRCVSCRRQTAIKLILQDGKEVHRKILVMCWWHLQATNARVTAKYYEMGGHPWKLKHSLH